MMLLRSVCRAVICQKQQIQRPALWPVRLFGKASTSSQYSRDPKESSPVLYAWTVANISEASTIRERPVVNLRSKEAESSHNRIHILGIGNLGRLYASCLAQLPDQPPITLVVHRKQLLHQWLASPGIEITRAGQVALFRDFDVEWWTEEKPTTGPVVEVAGPSGISNLIVATKASIVLPQIERLRRYLGSTSTVAFIQNGMCKLWPPLGESFTRTRFPATKRPNWIACVTTHGVYSLAPFKSVHASPATVSVGLVSSNPNHEDSTKYLMKQIAQAPDLSGNIVSRRHLWVLQLEKLVVNAVINPLTGILRCKNGEIFVSRGDNLQIIIDTLIEEASNVLRGLVLHTSSAEIVNGMDTNDITKNGESRKPDTADIETLLERFSNLRLRTMVRDIGHRVRHNTSSMLQDIQAGKSTEIRDFNGWLVDTARVLDLKLELPTHERMIELIENGVHLSRDRLHTQFVTSKDGD